VFSRILTFLVILSVLVACGHAMNTDNASAPRNTTPVATLKNISFSDAWVRNGAKGANSAGYVVITNNGIADILISASAPISNKIELHTVTNDNGMMSMHARRRWHTRPC
jgi:copper(I)-binding protein